MVDRNVRKWRLRDVTSLFAKTILVAVTFAHGSSLVRSSFGEAFCPSYRLEWRQRKRNIASMAPVSKPRGPQFWDTRYSQSGEQSLTAVSVFSRLGKDTAASARRTTADAVRGYCPRCQRPNIVCICHALPEDPIDCGTRVLILQHPREARKRKRTSTVPLIGLSVKSVEICVGTTFEQGSHPLLDEALSIANDPNSKHHAVLLYPSNRAVPLQDFLEEKTAKMPTAISNESDTSGNILVVVDGTWAQTQTMVQNSWQTLDLLPSVMFDDATNSLFDALRQEPAEHCTSTLEAVSRSIRLMGTNDSANIAAAALERSLQAMVDGQLRFANDDEKAKPRYYRKNGDETTTVSKRQERKSRKLVSKKLQSTLTLAKAKTPEEIEQDRIRFVYIAHMG